MDKKHLNLITFALIYFGGFLVWCLLDTRTAEITGLNGPRLFYMLVTPFVSIIYGVGSCKYTGKVIIPHLILLVAHLLFAVGTICIDIEDMTALVGIIVGIPISILCAAITKLVLYFIKKK
ncbi:MAG: hypothetical protein J6Q89_06230 [Clostridia bacterium]|nr:hypothetical protein [Clostridia bacterium]